MGNIKTAVGLVAWAKEWVGQRYWFGTCCYDCTTSLLSSKTNQYPTHYTATRMARYKKDIAEKRRCADCVGQIKGYLWGDEERQKRVYGFQGARDVGATGMFNASKINGPIATIPEVPGVLVWRSGHIGVYIGNGELIEARGFDYGVVKSKLKDRNFTHWCYCPWMTYDALPENGGADTPIPAPSQTSNVLATVKKGSKGSTVRNAQERLVMHGADLKVDGIFGPITDAATRAFQNDKDLKVDGIIGPMTWAALMVR